MTLAVQTKARRVLAGVERLAAEGFLPAACAETSGPFPPALLMQEDQTGQSLPPLH